MSSIQRMAQINLGILEAEEGQLPPVCIRCGRPASGFKLTWLSWFPAWIHFLLLGTFVPFLMCALLSRRHMRLNAPFCDAHRNYWRNRRLLRLAALALPLVLLGGFMVVFRDSRLLSRFDSPLIVAWGLSISWLILFASLRQDSLRALRIDEEDMDLVGVSREFAQQLEADRGMASERGHETLSGGREPPV